MAVESVKEMFETQLPKRLEAKPDLAQKLNTTYKFVVTGADAATWVVDLTQPGGKISLGDAPAKCTITIAGPDLLNIVNGKQNAQMAFMTGKLKVAGDMSLALKLGALLG